MVEFTKYQHIEHVESVGPLLTDAQLREGWNRVHLAHVKAEEMKNLAVRKEQRWRHYTYRHYNEMRQKG